MDEWKKAFEEACQQVLVKQKETFKALTTQFKEDAKKEIQTIAYAVASTEWVRWSARSAAKAAASRATRVAACAV